MIGTTEQRCWARIVYRARTCFVSLTGFALVLLCLFCFPVKKKIFKETKHRTKHKNTGGRGKQFLAWAVARLYRFGTVTLTIGGDGEGGRVNDSTNPY